MAIDNQVAANGLIDDVKASLTVWRKAPLLPIGTTLVVAVSSPQLLSLLFGKWAGAAILPTALFAIGWLGGTQLIWYRRAFDGQPISPGELIPLTWSMIARYFWLYLLLSLPIAVLLLVVALASHTLAGLQSPGPRIGLLAYGLVLAMVVTFMNPALAFSTRKVTKAIPIGLHMIVGGWPGNWGYVLVPGAVSAALGALYWWMPLHGQAVLEVVIALVFLAFAGAIARRFLRTANSGD